MKKFNFLLPLYIYEFFSSMLFMTPIWVLFFQSRGLSLIQLGLLSSTVYLASTLFEYPTGILADRYGRKTSMICANLLVVIAFLVEVKSYSFPSFLVASFLVGMAWAFQSGAREALIYDALKEKGLQKHNSKILGILNFIGAAGQLISVFFGSILFIYDGSLPYWMTISTTIIGTIALSLVREPRNKTKESKLDDHTDFFAGLKLLWGQSTLSSLFMLYIPVFFFEGAWHGLMEQPVLVGLGLPIVILGTYQAVKTGLSGFCGLLLPGLVKKQQHATLFFWVIFLESLVMVGLGADWLWVAIASSYLMLFAHSLWYYLDADIIHEHIPSNIRATTLSARQMGISLIWIFNPGLMGYLVSTFDRAYLFPVFGVIILVTSISVFLLRKRYLYTPRHK